jgi:hypothetical protein
MNALEKYQTLAATDPPDGREILAAWDVVERMRERGYLLTLTNWNGQPGKDWCATFEMANELPEECRDVWAASAADAILGAATAAMEREAPQ